MSFMCDVIQLIWCLVCFLIEGPQPHQRPHWGVRTLDSDGEVRVTVNSKNVCAPVFSTKKKVTSWRKSFLSLKNCLLLVKEILQKTNRMESDIENSIDRWLKQHSQDVFFYLKKEKKNIWNILVKCRFLEVYFKSSTA